MLTEPQSRTDVTQAGRWRLGPAIAALLFLAVNAFGLQRSPVVWIDEVTLNSPARVLATQGRLASGVFGATLHYDHHYFWQPPGLPIATAAVYRLFGFGIWQTRLVGLVAGAAAVYLVGRIAMQLGASGGAGLLASSLLAVDPRFIASARAARMDSPAIACLLAAFTILQRPRAPLVTALAGTATAIGVMFHPLAVVWVVPFLVRAARRDFRSGVAFAFGGAAVFAIWAGWMWPQRSLFVDQFIRHGEVRAKSESLFGRVPLNVEFFLKSWGRSPLVPLLAVVVLCLAVRAKRREDRLAGATVAIVAVVTLLVLNWNAGYYEQYWLPAVYVVAATTLTRSSGMRSVTLMGVALAVFATGVVVSVGGRAWVVVRDSPRRDYAEVERLVAQHVRAKEVVWGEPAAWYAVEKAGATLDLISSGSESVELPGSPNANRDDVLVVQSSRRADASLFRRLGYRFVARTRPGADRAYSLVVWRRVRE